MSGTRYRRPVRSRVQHGDPACADYGCTNDECLQARREKQKRNKYLAATGRPGLVGSRRAVARIERFRGLGYADLEIMSMLGLPRPTFYRVLREETITRKTEQRILSAPVPSPRAENLNLATVDATGTHRRLQALMVAGWPVEEITRRIGVKGYWVGRVLQRRRVSMVTESRVRGLYDQLWCVVPEGLGVDAVAAERTRFRARVEAWAPVGAWDDDTIDDPSAVPVLDAPMPEPEADAESSAARWLAGESVVLSDAARRLVIWHLMEWTADPVEVIAARLEMDPKALSRSWERIKKRERDAGRKAPWRRVYLTAAELGLDSTKKTKNEMKEAA